MKTGEENGKPNEERTRYNKKVDVYSFGIILFYIVCEKYPIYNLKNILNGILPELPPTIVAWVIELIHRCLQTSPDNRPTFNDIFEILRSHNFDLFNETNNTTLTIQQQKCKRDIKHRVRKIEAFEYQQRLVRSKH